MTKKSTKKALVLSVLSLVVCITMLVGTTFAWFTDSVTSANNIIKSGNLDVEMYWAKGTEDPDSAVWKDASKVAIFDYDNWEPGYTEVRHVKIANEGSLALKYKVAIQANGTVSELADVIDVYYVDPAVQVTDRTKLADENKLGTLTQVLAGMKTSAAGELLAGKADVITIALKMQESAGNQYMNKSIGTDFSVVLYATQYTSEADSFGKDYDADSKYEAPETGDGYPTATVIRSTAYENTELSWGSYGVWSPTEGLDSQLEAAYTFSCNQTLEEAKADPYANWYCDFYVKLDRNLEANQIFLGGNYGSFGWVGFHNGDMTLEANTELPLLGSVTTTPWTYVQVVEYVGTFICGVGDVDDALSGATFTVMLRLTNPEDATDYKDISTINYTFE